MEHEGIEAERELADIACARIGIEDLVQLLVVVAGRLHDFPVVEFEPDTVETGPLINRWRIKQDVALDAILHRAAENFTVRHIPIAAPNHQAASFIPKSQ